MLALLTPCVLAPCSPCPVLAVLAPCSRLAPRALRARVMAAVAPRAARCAAPRRCVSVRAASSSTSPLRKLGSSDLLVHRVCLGTMTWGKQNTETEAHEQLSYAIEQRGINFIDTAGEAANARAPHRARGRTRARTTLAARHVCAAYAALMRRSCGADAPPARRDVPCVPAEWISRPACAVHQRALSCAPCSHPDTALGRAASHITLTRSAFCQPAAVPTEAETQGRTDAYIASWLAKDKARRGKIVLATKVAGASERITWLRDGNKARTPHA